MSIFHRNENFKGFVKTYPVNTALVLLITLAFLYTILKGDISTGEHLREMGGLYFSDVYEEGEYFRLITSMFLHGSVMHYLFNTFFGLVILGASLEKLIGSVKYAIIYFVSGIGAGLIVLLFTAITHYVIKNEFLFFVFSLFTPSLNTVSIGASGAIYGVMGVFVYIAFFQPNLINEQDRRFVLNLLFINILFTLIMPRISVLGHLGGLLFGFLLSFIFTFKNRRNPFDPYY